MKCERSAERVSVPDVDTGFNCTKGISEKASIRMGYEFAPNRADTYRIAVPRGQIADTLA
jgi:hypothetical protein